MKINLNDVTHQVLLLFSIIFFCLLMPTNSLAQIDSIGPSAPFESPPYVPPPPPKSHLNFIDNGDGTLTETRSNLMWAKADSYADLGKCLNWYDSVHYAKKLRTGGYENWRLPSMKELGWIVDGTKENVKAWDNNPGFPLYLDEKFADGAAYWYWAEDHSDTDLNQCCALSIYFVTGITNIRRFIYCENGGVRPVRNMTKPVVGH